jgi:hypothetical protein
MRCLQIVRVAVSIFLCETQLNSTALSVFHKKHITYPLRAQQVNAVYSLVTIVY